MRVLVVGGTGYLGRALTAAARAAGHHVRAPGSAEFDLRQAVPVLDADVVVNCGYVPRGPHLQAVTVDGAIALAHAAAAQGIRLIQLSTDLVFAGRPEPYTPEDVPDPVDDYGRAKAAMERGVLDALPRALVVRTSLLWGATEPGPQERLVQRACAGEPITFFTNEVRCPIEVDVLARELVDELTAPSHGIVHRAGDEPLDRLAFAHRIAERLGLDASRLRGGAPPPDAPPRPGCVVLSRPRPPTGTG